MTWITRGRDSASPPPALAKSPSTEPQRPSNFFLRHGALFGALAASLVILYPMVLKALNPVPEEKDLLYERVKIIKLREFEPHLLMQKANGELMNGEFLTNLARWESRWYGLTDKERKNVIGCDAEIGYVKVRGSIFSERNRVMQIVCDRVHMPYYRSMSEHRMAWRRDLFFDALLLLTVVASVIGGIYVDRTQPHLRRKQK
jgi:hypothetical protein